MFKYSLIKTFTLFSLLTFILTGAVLSYFISEHIKSNQYDNLKEAAMLSTESIAQIGLDNSLSDAQKKDIEDNLKNNLATFKPQSIVLLDNKDSIVISDGLRDQNLTDENYDNAREISSLKGSFIISEPYKIKKSGAKEEELVFDIYVPVKNREEITGVLLLQIPDAVISSHAKMLIRTIVLTLSGGLLILYILLINILYRASKTLVAQNSELEKQKIELEESYKKLDDSYKATVSLLSNAVDARDPYTAGHSERVTKISLLLGETLNLSKSQLQNLEYAALFHDIGKIGIPDYILLKNGKLTDEEYGIIQQHPCIGVNILNSVNFLKDALPIIKHHHEKFGAKGYPDNLNGQEIPLGSRIIAIADAYDAMTTDRPYRKGFSHEAAAEEINRNRGLQFDNELVDIFMQIDQNIKNMKQSGDQL